MFVLAAFGKAISPRVFLQLLYSFSLGHDAAHGILIGLIILEAVTALLLIVRPRLGVPVATGLLVLITLVVTWLYLAGIHENFGCFGSLIKDQIGPIKIALNAIFLTILSLSWWLERDGHYAE